MGDSKQIATVVGQEVGVAMIVFDDIVDEIEKVINPSLRRKPESRLPVIT